MAMWFNGPYRHGKLFSKTTRHGVRVRDRFRRAAVQSIIFSPKIEGRLSLKISDLGIFLLLFLTVGFAILEAVSGLPAFDMSLVPSTQIGRYSRVCYAELHTHRTLTGQCFVNKTISLTLDGSSRWCCNAGNV